MTDFFISQSLCLFLLIITLIRPFFKSLLQARGISLFPTFAMIIQIFILLGQGLSLEGFPIFLFTLIAFLGSLPRVMRFFTGIQTDWYAPGGMILSVFGLVLSIFLLVVLFFTSPTIPPIIETPKAIEEETFDFYRTNSGEYTFEKPKNFFAQKAGTCTIWYPVQGGTKPISTVMYFPNVATSFLGRRIASTILAGNGYFVISAEFDFENSAYSAPFMGTRFFRIPILQIEQTLVSDMYSVVSTEADFHTKHQAKEMQKLLKAVQFLPSVPFLKTDAFFALAEGTSVAAVLSLTETNFFEKSVVIPSFGAELKETLKVYWNESTPLEAQRYKVLEITGEESDFLPFGEAEIQSPLFALLNGSKPDAEGKKSLIIGQKIRSFFDTAKPINLDTPVEEF